MRIRIAQVNRMRGPRVLATVSVRTSCLRLAGVAVLLPALLLTGSDPTVDVPPAEAGGVEVGDVAGRPLPGGSHGGALSADGDHVAYLSPGDDERRADESRRVL